MDGVTTDAILCWPRNCDYPLWREFIRHERNRFNRVIAVLTKHDGEYDYTDWLRKNCAEVDFIDSLPVITDWRNIAVNTALNVSTADRIWLTEQDFFVTDPGFWNTEGRVIGFDAGDNRPLHPACIFADRDLIEQTSRYFGPDPVDHFYTFGVELCNLAKPTLLTGGFIHMQGVTQNHFLLDRNEEAGVFKREQFREYLSRSLIVNVPLEEGWKSRAREEVRTCLTND